MIFLREPTIEDQKDFLLGMQNEADHFYPFVPKITTEEAYINYLNKFK